MLCLVGRNASLVLDSMDYSSYQLSSLQVHSLTMVQCCCQDGNFEKLRWPEPIYMHVGYVFESHFSAGTIKPISMIFGVVNEEWNFKKM